MTRRVELALARRRWVGRPVQAIRCHCGCGATGAGIVFAIKPEGTRLVAKIRSGAEVYSASLDLLRAA